MSSHRIRLCSLLIAIPVLAACGDPPRELAPDAAPVSLVPTSPAGTFAIATTLDLAVPASAAPVLAALAAATDGGDDPARYLLERMVAALPDGTLKRLALDAVPYLAAYLTARIAEVAPELAPGLAAISDRLARVAHHIGLRETLDVRETGAAVRTLTGIRVELGKAAVELALADHGLPDIAIALDVALDDTGQLALAAHTHRWPYGALLRLGLDHAVVPSVVPDAQDLGAALAALVDCERLGALVAEAVAVGPASAYRSACRTGMIAVASELYAQLAAIDDVPLALAVTGTATGVDRDGDGAMDELSGQWAGAVAQGASRTPIQAARFTGWDLATGAGP